MKVWIYRDFDNNTSIKTPADVKKFFQYCEKVQKLYLNAFPEELFPAFAEHFKVSLSNFLYYLFCLIFRTLYCIEREFIFFFPQKLEKILN